MSLVVAFQSATALDTKPASFNSETIYSISPGLTFMSGVVGPSINTYIGLAPLGGDEFYIGVDAGIAFFFPGTFTMRISLLPTAWYQFRISDNDKLRVVAGVAFGPSIAAGSGTSGVTTELLFRPGILYETSENMLLGVDLKLGLVGGVFAFKPQVNLVFSL